MVASAIQKGTFKIFAKVLASNVFPDPVGPSKTLLFSILPLKASRIDCFLGFLIWNYLVLSIMKNAFIVTVNSTERTFLRDLDRLHIHQVFADGYRVRNFKTRVS